MFINKNTLEWLEGVTILAAHTPKNLLCLIFSKSD